jgi:hypothetical protein
MPRIIFPDVGMSFENIVGFIQVIREKGRGTRRGDSILGGILLLLLLESLKTGFKHPYAYVLVQHCNGRLREKDIDILRRIKGTKWCDHRECIILHDLNSLDFGIAPENATG